MIRQWYKEKGPQVFEQIGEAELMLLAEFFSEDELQTDLERTLLDAGLLSEDRDMDSACLKNGGMLVLIRAGGVKWRPLLQRVIRSRLFGMIESMIDPHANPAVRKQLLLLSEMGSESQSQQVEHGNLCLKVLKTLTACHCRPPE